MLINGVNVTERGWTGHFCCGDRCTFTRNTLLEYKDEKWVVSTVGAMKINGKFETIGYERWYETMAFVAKEQNGYIEADVDKEINFSSEWGIFAETIEELKEKYPCTDNVANDMHETVVKELIEKIRSDS